MAPDDDQRFRRFFGHALDCSFGSYYETSETDRCREIVAVGASRQWVDLPLGPIYSRDMDRWRGGGEHRVLCERASWWLTMLGIDWVPDGAETYYAGGRADLAARDGSLFVEVGNTPARRVVAAILAEQPLLLVSFHLDVPPIPSEALLLTVRDRNAAERFRADDERAKDEAVERRAEKRKKVP